MYLTFKTNAGEIEYRGFTWGQKKALKKNGIDPSDTESMKQDGAIEAVVRAGLKEPDQVDDLLPREVRALYMAIIRESYVSGDEAKNSPGRPDSPPEESSGVAQPADPHA